VRFKFNIVGFRCIFLFFFQHHKLYSCSFFLFPSSQGCQEAHWKAGHKLQCKDFKANSSQTAKSNFGFKPSGGGSKSFSSIALVPASGGSNSKPTKKPGKVYVLTFFHLVVYLDYLVNSCSVM
jgi:ubiquitin carboxyl-terminal hydrolase 36/42